MAFVPIRIPRTTKPPLGTPIDWSNPLVQGLVGAWAFNEGGGAEAFNTVTGKSTPLYVSEFFGPNGLASMGNIGASTESIVLGNDFTILSIQKEATAYGAALGLANSSGLRWTSVEGGTTFRFLNRDPDGTTLIDLQPATGGGTSNTWITLASVMKSTTGSLYRDGKFLSSTVGSISVAGNVAWNVSLLGGSGRNITGSVGYIYLFNRALSPAEIAALSANPWQIYEPEIMWVDLGGGGGGSAYSQSVFGNFPAPAGVIVRSIGKAVTGNFPSQSGIVTRVISFHESVTGNYPNPTGVITKQTGKNVSGNFPSQSGNVVKQIAKTMAGNFPYPTGQPNELANLHKSVSGVMGTISGIVTSVLNPVIVVGNMLLKIIGSGLKKIIGG